MRVNVESGYVTGQVIPHINIGRVRDDTYVGYIKLFVFMEPRAGEHSVAFVMWKQVYYTDDVVRNLAKIFERVLPNCGIIVQEDAMIQYPIYREAYYERKVNCLKQHNFFYSVM